MESLGRQDMTSIGPSVHIVGEVRSDDDLLIEGRIEGRIYVGQAALTIGPHSRIDADIGGKIVTIRGDVRGTIAAVERISIAASASVTGTLTANHVIIADGAQVTGRIDMNRPAPSPSRWRNTGRDRHSRDRSQMSCGS